MNSRRLRLLRVGAGLALWFASTAGRGAGVARGHEFWLAPSNYQPATGQPVAVLAYNGVGFQGQLKPCSVPRLARLECLAGESIDLLGHACDRDPILARVTLPDGGGGLVIYQSHHAYLELSGERFEQYLRQEGLDDVLSARARAGQRSQPGRERFRRCAKAWLSGGASARAQVATGLPLELVPLADPGVTGHLPLQLLWEGRPLSGALVRAWHTPLDATRVGSVPTGAAQRQPVAPAFEGRTDATGRIVVPIDRAGEWLLNTVHMVPSAEPSAEWESTWASFTFATAAD